MKLLLVEWVDHCSGPDDWETIEDAQKLTPCRMESVGWLLKETPKYLLLASHGDGVHVHGTMCILKNCVVTRKVLRP